VLEEKSLMQSDLSVKTSEITLLKTNEKRLLRDSAETRERAKSLEEELHKVIYRYPTTFLIGNFPVQKSFQVQSYN
jgi:hypothetical protein